MSTAVQLIVMGGVDKSTASAKEIKHLLSSGMAQTHLCPSLVVDLKQKIQFKIHNIT
jgi:hypothetical protein